MTRSVHALHVQCRLVLLLVSSLLVIAAPRAEAHPLDVGYLRITTTADTVRVSLDLDVSVADAAPREMAVGGCTLGPEQISRSGRTVTITRTATRCSGPRTLELPFLRHMPAAFQLLAQQGSDTLALVDHSAPVVAIAPRQTVDADVTFAAFVVSGVVHIGAAPSEWRAADGGLQLPDGIDHILFLLGLLLAGGSLLRLAGVATGFTIGHSITLALAALGIVHIPGSIIEPLIALSIAFVAFESLTSSQRLACHRWKIALGFGLVHGFGFANALTELDLDTAALAKALVGYNLGVELGQLAIVLVLAPLVLAAHRRRWAHVWLLRPIALLIGLAGLYWFVARLLEGA